jgi:hypothetical protein
MALIRNLLPYHKTEQEKTVLKSFCDTWPGNFALQRKETVGTLEQALAGTAEIIDGKLIFLQSMPDVQLIPLISEMRQMAILIWVYNNNETSKTVNGVSIIDFRNSLIWTSDVLERYITTKYIIS